MKWFFQSGAWIFGVLVSASLYAATVEPSVTTIAATVVTNQRDYRWYLNEDALTPGTSAASENTATTTPSAGGVLRLRMNVGVTGLDLGSGATFLLQYSDATSSGWTTVGTSTAWIFFDNPGVADGAIIATTVLGSSDVGESYGESNPSAASPNAILTSQEGEWDWAIRNNSAATSSNWYFRMIFSSSTVFDAYTRFPSLTAQAAAPAPPGGGGGGGSITGGSGPGPSVPGTPRLEVKVPPPERPPSPCDSPIVQRVDFNRDCRVDIIDLSILVYYYERRGPDVVPYDLTGDELIDLADVSVVMFYWTG
jgi:hypothetical protein